MQGSVVRSWLLELAARAFKANGAGPRAHQGLRRRLRRGPLDDPGGDRPRRPGAGHHALAADPLPLAPGRFVRRQGARRAPQRVRRPRSQDRVAAGSWRRPGARRRPRPRPRSRRRTLPRSRSSDPRRSRSRRPADPRAPGPAAQGRAADDQGAAPRPRGQAGLAREAGSRTSCARAFASSASRIRRSWCCSGRPATSPIARSSRRSTSCGGPTCCRTSSCSWPSAAGRTTTRRSGPRSARRSSSSAGSCRSTRTPGARSPSGSPTSDSTSTIRRASTPWPRASTKIDEEHGTRGNHLYLPRHPAVAVRGDRRPARAGRARPRASRRRLAAGRHREAVRARPGLGEAAQPRGRQGLPRVAGLSHRPLPRQGDGPQPAGLPLRQRHLRAALEPALRRPRADHRGRVDRHREPRRVLRADRRLARRPPEPPPPARQPGRDGAAGHVRGRRAARREGQGPARHRDHPGGCPGQRRARPVRPGLGRRHAGPGLSRGAGRRPGVRRPRRSSPPSS